MVHVSKYVANMNLVDFFHAAPVDIAEYVVPSSRVLQMLRVSRDMKKMMSKMRCGVDVEPSKRMKQTYTDVTSSVAERQAAMRVFMHGSLSLNRSSANFHIHSFTMHGIHIENISALIETLRQSPRLAVLDLYNNHIKEDLIYEVFAAIPPSVTTLKLARQWINRAAVTPLCVLLERLVLLTELDLSENYLNSQGMEAITASISSQQLTHVCLGFNHLKSRFWNEHPQLGFDRFVLKKLDLQHNLLQGVFCDSVYSCVRGSAAVLTSLDVSHNDLRMLGVSCLSACLQECLKLRHLNVAGNLCGDAAAALLFGALKPPVHGYDVDKYIALESLDVAHNQLTGTSARQFIRCMSDNCRLQQSLTSVSFSYNELHDVGAQLIIEALMPCPVIKLSLAQCMMGESTGMCLSETMQHWPELEFLDIHANRLCETSLGLIARNLAENDSRGKEIRCTSNCCMQQWTQELQRTVADTHAYTNASTHVTRAEYIQPERVHA
jgi:Ran GTPase-activating protein (RanGAP) involved in mRNA processing and transport